MKKTKLISIKSLFLVLILILPIGLMAQKNKLPKAQKIKKITKKVADWQIKTYEDMGVYRALPENRENYHNRIKHHELEWTCAALYAGMNQWTQIADDTEYIEWLKSIGERNNWQLHKRPYHADDHAVGQFYLSMYAQIGDQKMLEPTQTRFNWILENPKSGSLLWDADEDAQNRWGWCDALFMAPPVWARLAKITENQKFLDFMDREYHATYDLLYDHEEHLFWRDSSFFEKREKNGTKVFWARGNGWVFGGLALMIPDLPSTWEGRQFYVDLFIEMAYAIKEIQREDGTWSMGLLGGEDGYPIKETSGTSFYTFGLAWGVNNGILDQATFEPVILKAWKALEKCVNKDGMLGYVQPIGAAPGDSFSDYTEVYGIGAFLAAGTEMYKYVERESNMKNEK